MMRRFDSALYMHASVACIVQSLVQSLVEWARPTCTLVFLIFRLGIVYTLLAIMAGRVSHHFLTGLVVSIFTRFDWINSYYRQIPLAQEVVSSDIH